MATQDMRHSLPGIRQPHVCTDFSFVVFPSEAVPILLVAVLLVAIGLTASNFHYLSEVIAGAFVGCRPAE